MVEMKEMVRQSFLHPGSCYHKLMRRCHKMSHNLCVVAITINLWREGGKAADWLFVLLAAAIDTPYAEQSVEAQEIAEKVVENV